MAEMTRSVATEVAKSVGCTIGEAEAVIDAYWAETNRLFRENWSQDGDCNVITACVKMPGLGRLFCSAGPYDRPRRISDRAWKKRQEKEKKEKEQTKQDKDLHDDKGEED